MGCATDQGTVGYSCSNCRHDVSGLESRRMNDDIKDFARGCLSPNRDYQCPGCGFYIVESDRNNVIVPSGGSDF